MPAALRTARHSRSTAACMSSPPRGKYQARFHWPTSSNTAPCASRPVMHRRAARRVEEIALGMVDDGAERHRRIGRAERGEPDLRDRLAERIGGNGKAVHVGRLALVGRHAVGGVALDMLDGAHALAHGQADVLGGHIVLEVDEGLDAIVRSPRPLAAPSRNARPIVASPVDFRAVASPVPPARPAGGKRLRQARQVVRAVAGADASAILRADAGQEAPVAPRPRRACRATARTDARMASSRRTSAGSRSRDLLLAAPSTGSTRHGLDAQPARRALTTAWPVMTSMPRSLACRQQRWSERRCGNRRSRRPRRPPAARSKAACQARIAGGVDTDLAADGDAVMVEDKLRRGGQHDARAGHCRRTPGAARCAGGEHDLLRRAPATAVRAAGRRRGGQDGR